MLREVVERDLFCFVSDEDSTMGIDVDPFHFEGTTVTWRTGTAVEEQGNDSGISFT